MRLKATSVCGLKLLVYEALSYSGFAVCRLRTPAPEERQGVCSTCCPSLKTSNILALLVFATQSVDLERQRQKNEKASKKAEEDEVTG
jgi:hypothetical protein